MHPISHLLIGWTLANGAKLEKRDRMLVTIAGVIPDLDGLGVIADILTEKTKHPLYLYDDYHHVLAHNLGFGLLMTFLAILLSKRRFLCALLVLLSFHLHILGDIAGSRGPDGYQWPIPYLWPLRNTLNLTWKYQWELKAWPNVITTIFLLALTIYWSWKKGRSVLEMISISGDAALTRTLRNRFGMP